MVFLYPANNATAAVGAPPPQIKKTKYSGAKTACFSYFGPFALLHVSREPAIAKRQVE